MLHAAQIDLRRNMAVFQSAFHEALREKVGEQLSPRSDSRRKLDTADWQSLSLVEDSAVEERMNFVRLGQMISHECDWQLRELAAYMGSVLGNGRADDEANPLRAEVVGSALYRAIESVTNDRESRQHPDPRVRRRDGAGDAGLLLGHPAQPAGAWRAAGQPDGAHRRRPRQPARRRRQLRLHEHPRRPQLDRQRVRRSGAGGRRRPAVGAPTRVGAGVPGSRRP